MWHVNQLAAHVEAERNRRGWSVRGAAQRGGISNQTWGTFEKGGVVTNKVRAGVAEAFGWPTTWPESPPALTPLVEGEPTPSELMAKLDQVLASTAAIQIAVQSMGDVVERLAGPGPKPRSPSDQTSQESRT